MLPSPMSGMSSAPTTPHRQQQGYNQQDLPFGMNGGPGPGESLLASTAAAAAANGSQTGPAAWLAALGLSAGGGDLQNSSSFLPGSRSRAGSLQRTASSGRSSRAGLHGGAHDGAAPSFSSFAGLSGSGPVRAAPLQNYTQPGSQSSAHGMGAWLPPATAAAMASASKGSAPAAAASGHSDAGTPGRNGATADALREEAQRSVDALLARRKAELRQ